MARSQSILPWDARRGLRHAALARAEGPGSTAARFAPNQYGSILSRKYPGLFGADGALNPEHQTDLKQQQHMAGLRQNVNDHRYVQSLITPEDRRSSADAHLAQGLYLNKRKRQLMSDPYALYDLGDLYGG